VVVSALGLVALTPLFLLISALIRVDSPGPILFRHCVSGYGVSLPDLEVSLDVQCRRRTSWAQINPRSRVGWAAKARSMSSTVSECDQRGDEPCWAASGTA
jgi:lipopolysaccharide/colanic/teichoic acid biosynthesis glycosyltransferase